VTESAGWAHSLPRPAFGGAMLTLLRVRRVARLKVNEPRETVPQSVPVSILNSCPSLIPRMISACGLQMLLSYQPLRGRRSDRSHSIREHRHSRA
jgi:hypothetical protein